MHDVFCELHVYVFQKNVLRELVDLDFASWKDVDFGTATQSYADAEAGEVVNDNRGYHHS
jgi:hypothetical protein